MGNIRKSLSVIRRHLIGISPSKTDETDAVSDLECPSLHWPYFDADAYRADYPDIALAGISPQHHYKRHGWLERRRTSPYFDPTFYIETYLQGSVDIDPLHHYVTQGWKKGFSPSPYFSTSWYLQNNADIAANGIEPLEHYILWGWKEGRNPSPYFNIAVYLQNNPDIRESGIEPLRHYMQYGFIEKGRNPNEFLDTSWYRSTYAADLGPDEDPLLHYISKGSGAGYSPGPRFDAAYYLAKYPEVREYGEPLAHYLEHGRFERRSPHADRVETRNERLEEWSRINGSSRRRMTLLTSALDLPQRRADPDEATRLDFLRRLGDVRCVSFDIFDTLVERRSGKPETVFALLDADARRLGYVGENFVVARQAAERRARHIAGLREVTIAEIYDELPLSSGLSAADRIALAEAESRYEIQLCERKSIGHMLFETARSAKLRIFLLSDIYLNRASVEAILEKAGIRGYEALFVSSELGSSKHYGGMYELLLHRTNLRADQLLHIGDNCHSDGDVPHARGIGTLLMARSDAMTVSPALARWYSDDPVFPAGCWKAIVGGELLYDESLARGGNRESSARHTGARILGPPLLAFAQFVARRARSMGYERLYFASRDGFYLKEAYDALRESDPGLPPSFYFLASRRVCRAAGIASLEDVLEVAEIDHYPMAVRNFLTARFLLTDDDLAALPVKVKAELDRVVQSSRSDTAFLKTLRACLPVILRRCITHAEAYKLYLKQAGMDRPGAAIVDIGYRGTIQRNVSDLTGIAVDGLYFVTWPEVQSLLSKGLRYSAFIASNRDASEPIVRYVQLLELFFSGTHGSVQHFEIRSGQPEAVLADPDTDLGTRRTLNAMRAGALAFIRDIAERYPVLLANPIPDGVTTIEPLVEFLRSPSRSIVEGLRNHRFEDSFGGETRFLVMPQDAELSYQEALARSCWHEGFAVARRPKRGAMLQDEWGDGVEAADTFQGGRTIAAATESSADSLSLEAAYI